VRLGSAVPATALVYRPTDSSRQGEAPPLGAGLALGVQGGESPTLGTELGAEGAGAQLRRTSDGPVY